MRRPLPACRHGNWPIPTCARVTNFFPMSRRRRTLTTSPPTIIGPSASNFRLSRAILLRRRRVVTCGRRAACAAVLPGRHVAFGAGAEHQAEADERQEPQHGAAATAQAL